jgi:hypothetical protein
MALRIVAIIRAAGKVQASNALTLEGRQSHLVSWMVCNVIPHFFVVDQFSFRTQQ